MGSAGVESDMAHRCDCENEQCRQPHEAGECMNEATIPTLYSSVCLLCAVEMPSEFLITESENMPRFTDGQPVRLPAIGDVPEEIGVISGDRRADGTYMVKVDRPIGGKVTDAMQEVPENFILPLDPPSLLH